jgi:hypothetical protein
MVHRRPSKVAVQHRPWKEVVSTACPVAVRRAAIRQDLDSARTATSLKLHQAGVSHDETEKLPHTHDEALGPDTRRNEHRRRDAPAVFEEVSR